MQPEQGPDGILRARAEHQRLNELLATVFKGDAGKSALDYLRSISIERVCGPHATDAELRHLEGMRFIVAVISQRISAHHKEHSHVADSRAKPDTFANPRPKRPGGPVRGGKLSG
jgi:hypothetical protein